jgi:hypothetical protein
MKAKELMKASPYCCRPEMNLGMAAELMWNGNYGFLPIVGSARKLLGVFTVNVGQPPELSDDEVVKSYQAIARPEQIATAAAT